MPRVAIIGVGQSVHTRQRTDVAHAELLLESIDEALADAGVSLSDIDGAATASLDVYDGRTIANMSVAEVVGSYLKSESRVCSDAIGALAYGWSRVADGGFELTLVTAHCKESEGRLHDIENAALDPFSQRRLPGDADIVAGLHASILEGRGRLDRRRAAEVVAAARTSSAQNDKVETLPEVGVDEVLEAGELATPLRRLDRAPRSDGSCTLVVASEDVAARLDVRPVWVTGVATVTGGYWSDRDPDDVSALETAYRRAREMAGWNGDAADLVEVSGPYSYHVVQHVTALGGDLDALGTKTNPSGGWHAGNPTVVTGLSRVAECVHQLRGTAGPRQQDGVRRALAHGVVGLGAQTHTLALLEGDG